MALKDLNTALTTLLHSHVGVAQELSGLRAKEIVEYIIERAY